MIPSRLAAVSLPAERFVLEFPRSAERGITPFIVILVEFRDVRRAERRHIRCPFRHAFQERANPWPPRGRRSRWIRDRASITPRDLSR